MQKVRHGFPTLPNLPRSVSFPGGGYSPLSLFALAEPGAWYDPSDLSTMFQDVAGTVPVTAAGQSVALIRDKSGRGNHASQGTAASRPLYQVDGNGKGHLVFDGVDDFLTSATITPGTDKGQVFAGVRKASDAAVGYVVDTTANIGGANNGGLAILGPPTAASTTWRGASKGTTLQTATSAASFAAPITNVVGVLGDISAPSVVLRVNGADAASSTASQGTGNYLAYAMYIGRRAGTVNPFNGNLYGLICRFGANLDAASIASAEQFMASKTGVTL